MPPSLRLLALLAPLAACGSTASTRSAAPLAPSNGPQAQPSAFEADAHAFPALRDASGAKLADGEVEQWLDGERLHLRLRFDWADGRTTEELVVLRQRPALVQESWSWSETRDGVLQRRFSADLVSGAARAEARADGELRTWNETLEVEPGRTFAGAGWPHALRNARAELVGGETIAFRTVGFTPEPRGATVEVSYAGPERLPLAGRTLAADRFLIHPDLSWLARLVVTVPDSSIWLTREPPIAFLRWEGPLAEPDDPIVRVDAFSGEPSGPATPE